MRVESTGLSVEVIITNNKPSAITTIPVTRTSPIIDETQLRSFTNFSNIFRVDPPKGKILRLCYLLQKKKIITIYNNTWINQFKLQLQAFARPNKGYSNPLKVSESVI